MSTINKVFAETLGRDHIGTVVKVATRDYGSLGTPLVVTVVGTLEAVKISVDWVQVRIGDQWHRLDRNALVEVEDW